jgi:hypothetical protein
MGYLCSQWRATVTYPQAGYSRVASLWVKVKPSGDGPRLQGWRDRAGKGAFGFHLRGPERAFEEFVKLRTEGEEVNRSARRSRTVAQMNKMFAEINEKYDSEFVGPPL